MAVERKSSSVPAITREVVDFLLLDDRADPDALRQQKWEDLRHDRHFMEAIHGAIVLSTHLPDASAEESFLKGVAFGLKAMQDTIRAAEADNTTLDTLPRS